MIEVTVTCERCLKSINGFETEFGTGGFYRVDKLAWMKYQRNCEKIICDSCMHKDSNYRRDFVWTK